MIDLNLFRNLNIDIGRHTSGQVKTQCPFCPARGNPDDTSLSVNIDEGIYLCHYCGTSGTVKSPQNPQNDTFKPSQTKPDIKLNVAYKPTTLKPLTSELIEFFKKRGISKQTLIQEKVGCCDKYFKRHQKTILTYAFPFIKNGIRVNTKYRTLNKDLLQDFQAEKCFWRYDKLVDAETIYITEGEFDSLALIESGYDSGVVSVPEGAPNAEAKNIETKMSFLTAEAFVHFSKAKQVILVVDNDDNGRRLQNELKRRIGIHKCLSVIYPEGCKDINDVLVKHGKDQVKSVINNAKHFPVAGLKTFEDYESEIFDMYNGISKPYYKTGWPLMDNHYKVRGGQLCIVTGSPGSGKSEWLDALVINLIQSDQIKWAIYSPENYPVEVYFRKFAERIGKDRLENLSHSDIKNCIKITSEYIKLIVDNEIDPVNIDYLFKHIELLIFRDGIKAIVIDPWNEIEHDIGPREDIYLSKTLRQIKRFIRKYDLICFLVAHPRKPTIDKEGKYNRITAYDIAGGYTWYAKADNIFSVWRDKKNNSAEVEVEIIKIKQKTDGQLGTCTFTWDWKTGIYEGLRSSLDLWRNDENFDKTIKDAKNKKW